MSPVRVSASSSTLARPKSLTQTTPSVSSRRFDGLMSRWRMPRAWAWARAEATCRPICATPRWNARCRDSTVESWARPASRPTSPGRPRGPPRPGPVRRRGVAGAARRRPPTPPGPDRTGRSAAIGPPPSLRRARACPNRPAGSPGPRGSAAGWRPRRDPAPQPPQLVDDRVQALPLDELHRVVLDVALLADLEDRHDVGVVQPRRGAGLAAEPLQRRAVPPAGQGRTFSATRRPSETCSAS